MKKIISILLLIAMIFSLSACGNKEKAEKYCSSCGEGILNDVAFCEHCGAAVGDTKTESESNSSDNSTSTESKVNKVEETSKPSSPAQNTSKPTETSKPTTSKPVETQKPGHTHSYSKKVTAATCTEKGYTTYTCSCGDTYKDSYVDAAHTYSSYVCSKCGAIDKTHSYEYLVDFVKKNGQTYGSNIYFRFNDRFALCYSATYDDLEFQQSFDYNGYNLFSELNLETYKYGCIYSDNAIGGTINPTTFTSNSPIAVDYFEGLSSNRGTMAEIARFSVYSMLEALEGGLEHYKTNITISDLGFTSF